MCFLSVDKGPCTESKALWYYDSHNGVCAQFIYGGCEGNSNRFQNRQECEQKCGDAQGYCFSFLCNILVYYLIILFYQLSLDFIKLKI